MDTDIPKLVRWLGSVHGDWKSFPDEIQNSMGYALYLAQLGKKAPNAKPLKGFRSAAVLEISDDFDGNTWRAVYTVQFQNVIYVLHAFQKKSKQGKAMPKADMNLIVERFKQAKDHYAKHKS
ncbi:MAG: type II toxin-antitoxin system RelE/ParE family toxin [Pseudohongiellaceae bacterium]